MASNGNSLSEEFKCPICLGDVTDPKYMGPCQHSACLLCVTSLIWNNSRKDVLSCPVCREDCPVPEGGIQDLKDNFQLKAIMEKLKNMPKHAAGIECAVCKNDASHFCKDCDGIYLCRSCATKHDQNPDTSAHVLIGICKDDGKTLTKFCGGCNQAVCSVCRIAKHSGGGHDVNSHDKVVEIAIAKINEEIATLGRNVEEMDQYKEKLQLVHKAVVERIVSDCELVMERSNAAITITEKKRDELSKRQCQLKQKITELSEELAVVDAVLGITDREITEFMEKRDEYCKDLGHQEQLFSTRLNKAIHQAAAGIKEIQGRIDLGRAEASAKIVLDDNTVPSLVSTREQLQELSIAAVQENDLASFEDLENKMLRFVPGDDDMEIGHLVGDLLVPEYTSIEKVADLAYPPDRPCRTVYRLKHDDDRVLSLYSSGDEGADTICKFDPRLTDECLMKITRNISQGIDMATNSEGELILLGRTRPAIRAFNDAANTLRNIDVSFDNTLDVHKNWSIETDDKGNIFVLNDENLLLFKADGTPVSGVNVHIGKAWKMSFCRPKRFLYIAAHNNIIIYHWDGCVLSHISSRPHGVEGFICGDVCLGSDGEVFVSGIMSENHEIRIYQIVEAEQTREEEKRGADLGRVAHGEDVSKRDVGEDANQVFKMTRINFGDNYQPTVTNLLPWISVRGNTLVLGYDSKTEVFKLLP